MFVYVYVYILYIYTVNIPKCQSLETVWRTTNQLLNACPLWGHCSPCPVRHLDASVKPITCTTAKTTPSAFGHGGRRGKATSILDRTPQHLDLLEDSSTSFEFQDHP